VLSPLAPTFAPADVRLLGDVHVLLRQNSPTALELRAVLRVFGLGGAAVATLMDVLWQINYGEMLSGLMVTTFLMLLAASVAVVCLMVMLPLIDLAFKKKVKPASANVETSHQEDLAAHDAQLSGPSWLALRSDFLRGAVLPSPLVGMAHRAVAHPPLEHITPLIDRSLGPKNYEAAPPDPVTAPPKELTEEPERPSRAA
jgi:hypothetical protein